MANQQARTSANADTRNSELLAAKAPRAHEGADRARRLLADLGRFFSPRERQRSGVYLPLVRIDGE